MKKYRFVRLWSFLLVPPKPTSTMQISEARVRPNGTKMQANLPALPMVKACVWAAEVGW